MAKVAGYVREIRVDVGDKVAAGQVLAILEVPEMESDVTKAKAGLDRYKAEVARARDELRRVESARQLTQLSLQRLSAVAAARPGLLAPQELDEAKGRDSVAEAQAASARSGLVSAQEQVKVAMADLERALTLQRYTTVVAPFEGVITRRYADPGSMIQAGTASQTQAMPVVRLSQNGRLRLILPVPESAVPMARVGTPVEVQTPALRTVFQGRIARLSERIQTSTRTMLVEVDVANPRGDLVPGMFAEARITLDRRAGALAVPIAAIQGEGAGASVRVVNADGRLEIRKVVTGLETADLVEVKAGLAPGERVVIGGRGQLREGQAVRAQVEPVAAKPEVR